MSSMARAVYLAIFTDLLAPRHLLLLVPGLYTEDQRTSDEPRAKRTNTDQR